MKKLFILVLVLAFFTISAFTQTVQKINIALELQKKMELSKDKVEQLFKMRKDLQKYDVNQEAKLELAELDLEELMRNREAHLSSIKAKLDEMALFRSARKYAQIETEVKLWKMLDKKQKSTLGQFLEEWHAKKREKEVKQKKMMEIREKEIHRESEGGHGEVEVLIEKKGEHAKEVKKEIKVKKKK